MSDKAMKWAVEAAAKWYPQADPGTERIKMDLALAIQKAAASILVVARLCGPIEPPLEITEPDKALVEALRELGEDHGYGACMHTLSELWAQKIPGGNHTCGPGAGTVAAALKAMEPA